MKKLNPRFKYRSKCCDEEVKTEGLPDFMGGSEICTVNFVCLKCGEPCDIKKDNGGIRNFMSPLEELGDYKDET